MTSADITSWWVAVWEWLKHVLSVAIPLMALFTWLGQRWVERLLNRDLEKFKREQQEKLEGFKGEQQEKLEGFKGEQQKELERLRHLLSTRVSKIHEREFKILPKAWLMLNELRGHVLRAIDLTMKSYPDFKNFSEIRLEAFLNSDQVSSFSEDQKSELRKANDKAAYYMNALKGHYIDEANEKHRVFLNYLIENRIFMTDDLRAKFYDAQTALFSALTNYSVGTDANNWELVRKGQEDMLNKMQRRIDEVEEAIQARLHYEDAY